MKLLRLTLRNFKGQAFLDLEPKGMDIDIFGDNGAGKSTIADAFFWLFFDKDSAGRKDFEIKTIDAATGEPIHFLEHEVSARIQGSDGESIELAKTYREKWVASRGQAAKEFSGHTTDYKVNGVPVQKNEFDRWIAGICDEKRFRLLTDPACFNSDMLKTSDDPAWRVRRKILIEVCGDVSDADVIASQSNLAGLPAILGKHRLEDYRKIIVNRRKEVAEQINKIPVRIDELQRSMPAAGVKPPDTAPLKADLQKLSEDRARITAGGEVAEKTKRLRELEGDAQAIVNSLRLEGSKSFDAAQQALRNAEASLSMIETEIESVNSQRYSDIRQASRYEVQLEDMRDELRKLLAQEFVFDGSDTCAACGQSLPADKVADARSIAEGDFNERKSKKLEGNKASGRELRSHWESRLAAAKDKELEVDRLTVLLDLSKSERNQCKAAADALQSPTLDLSTSKEYQANQSAQESIKAEIETLRSGSQEAIAEVDVKIAAVTQQIGEADKISAQLSERIKSESRIAELKTEERGLATEIDRIDGELFMTEEFIRAKVSLLTDRINSRFRHARFKLFDSQVNGAISEVCETTYLGVPYGSLNHGSKLNVGLDIIDTLAEHYRFAPCIFIDNAESVTRIVPTAGQQIRLVVSEPDKALRVQIQEPAKEAISA